MVNKGLFRGFPAAIKSMLPDSMIAPALRNETAQRSAVQSFLEEMVVCSRLRHPNIIQFYGCSYTMPSMIIVCELASRGSFFDILTSEDPTLTIEQPLLRICEDLASAMRYLHAFSPPVMHRDLKSANVLISSSFEGKLTDFGCSQSVDEFTHELSTMCGTPYWLAPEVVNGSDYNTAADVYSFAIVLCEIGAPGGRIESVFGIDTNNASMAAAVL